VPYRQCSAGEDISCSAAVGAEQCGYGTRDFTLSDSGSFICEGALSLYTFELADFMLPDRA
jgi:hypothetical protein